MSLSVDGVWKAGVWAETVWADGVWREGDAAQAEAPSGGFGANFGDIYRRYRSDEEVRRERIERGIIPPDLPEIDAEAVREASREPLEMLARKKLRARQDLKDFALVEDLTLRLMEAQRREAERAYKEMLAELKQAQSEIESFNRNQNASAVLVMLGLL